MDIVIIDYNAGNTQSVKEAVRRCGFQAFVTSDRERIRKADRIIFPGVGHAGTAWWYLKQNRLDKLLPDLTQPVLGICLGLQLLCSASEEAKNTGIGIFAVQVKRFPGGLKVPHMGWNTLKATKGPLFQSIPTGSYVYFVHSYYAEICDQTNAECDYGLRFSAGLEQDNFYALQFHPEKSGAVGETILKNFLVNIDSP
jgi:glutamine amidotransferase